MKKLGIFLLFIMLVTGLFGQQVVLNYYYNAIDRSIIELFEAQNPDIKINLVEMPENTNQKLQLIQTILFAKDSSMDLFDADVTWAPIFSSAGWVAPLSKHFSDIELDAYLPGPLNSVTYNDEIWGIPYRTDAGILYYRKDLLEKYNKPVPETWEELVETSKYIMVREPGMKGLSGSWAQFEGLTCNLMEIVWSYGGEVLDENGKVIINSKETLEALKMMDDMISKHRIMPDGIVNFYSGDARAVFFAGNSVFLRDWPTGWLNSQNPSVSKIVGKVGISDLPKGDPMGRSYSTLGGWQVMVSEYSKNKEAAIRFAKFRAGLQAQKIGAVNLSHIPALKSLYSDLDVLAKMPFIQDMYPAFYSAYPRPKSPYYAEISNILQTETQMMFVGRKTPERALRDMEFQIKMLLGQF